MIKRKKTFFIGIGFIFLFLIWTLSVRFIDIQYITATGTSVGFATLNIFFHELIRVNMPLYILTDWLGLLPIGIAFCFAVIGLIQMLKRKSLFKVDYTILLLGAFYIAVILIFLFFEIVVINYRPILIDGNLEPSYPSSTTMLSLCVMPTALPYLTSKVKNRSLRLTATLFISFFTAFMLIGRLLSGVHWLTDIIGGIFISTALVLIYYSLIPKNYPKTKT